MEHCARHTFVGPTPDVFTPHWLPAMQLADDVQAFVQYPFEYPICRQVPSRHWLSRVQAEPVGRSAPASTPESAVLISEHMPDMQVVFACVHVMFEQHASPAEPQGPASTAAITSHTPR